MKIGLSISRFFSGRLFGLNWVFKKPNRRFKLKSMVRLRAYSFSISKKWSLLQNYGHPDNTNPRSRLVFTCSLGKPDMARMEFNYSSSVLIWETVK